MRKIATAVLMFAVWVGTAFAADKIETKELTKKEKDELHSFILKNIVNILDNLAVTLHYQKMIRDKITYSDLIHLLNTEKDSSTMVGVNGNQFSTLVECGYIQKGILETYVELN